MIKKIGLQQLKPGMYVHDLNCGWMDHPFFSSKFKIKSEADVAEIRRLGIRDMYIDTAKGLDVVEAPTAEQVERDLGQAMEQTAEEFEPDDHPSSVKDERERAQCIQEEANEVISDLMEDVRLGKQIEVERVNPLVSDMVDSIFRNQDALLGLTRIRQMDRYTFQHSVSVSVLLVSFARSLGLDRQVIQELGVGGLLHDIGKVLIPNSILNKPGRLTDAEFQVMRKHAAYSRDLLTDTPGISPVALAVAAEHHERVDGSGYPARKTAETISKYGQMAAIVDVYDAISSDRVYHKAMQPHASLRKLLEWSQHHFNTELVHQFIRCVGIYPVGTVVRLESGGIGVIIESGRSSLLQPVVRVLMDAQKRGYVAPHDVDLALADRITGAEQPEHWHISPEDYIKA